MIATDIKIDLVKDGPELQEVLDQVCIVFPSMNLWPEAIAKRNNDVIVARIGSMAVGIVTIRWAGAYPVTALSMVTGDNYPDADRPIPALYTLNVNPKFRRLGIARRLMLGAEGIILARDDVENIATFTVREDNEPAIRLYNSMGYGQIMSKMGNAVFDVPVPLIDTKTGKISESNERSIIMAREL